MTDLTEGYVCASCDARPDSKCFRHGEKWLCGTCFDEARIAEKDADLAALRERLAAALALSESRRMTLLAKSEELAAEWKRAETAEAKVAAAERAGIERAASAANERLTHCHPVLEDRLGSCRACEQAHIESRIRALLPAAVAEPAAKSLQDEIGAWGDVTFPNSTQQTIIAHLRSEVNEEIAPDCDPEELADAATLVMQLAHKRKLNLDALVRAKFEKNKRRKWAWDEKAGFSRHVKEAEPAAKCATCGGTNSVIEREEQVRNESGVFEWHVHRGPCPACAAGGGT